MQCVLLLELSFVRCRVFILPIGFGDGLLGPDTGLVHLGCREYDPRIGRFDQ
jgi:hypothetical protein